MKTLDILKGFIFCCKLIGKYDQLYVDFSFNGLDKDWKRRMSFIWGRCYGGEVGGGD